MSRSETNHPSKAAFDEAVEHHQAGRVAEAEAIYLRIAQQYPNHADAIHMLGVIAHQQGNHGKAAELIRQAIALNGDSAPYYSNLGVTLRAMGRLEEAAEQLQQAVTLNPDYAVAQKNLGVTLRGLGRSEEAVKRFRRALEIDPDDVGTCKSLGASCIDLGRAEEAAELFARAVALVPDDPEAHNNLGVAMKDLGRFGESEQSLRKAIKLDPTRAEAYNNLGLTLSAQGDYDEAVELCRQAIDLAPDFTMAHSNLGVALKEQGKLAESLTALRRALELDPKHVAAHNNLGDVLNSLGRHEEAVKHLTRAIKLDPNCHEAYNNLGLALNNLERPVEATRYLERSLELSPVYVPAHINLGNALVSQGRIEEGTAHYLQALDLQPDCVAAYYSLAINSRRTFSDEEIHHTESLLSADRQSEDDRMLLSFTLAQIVAKEGRHDEAFEYCRQANDLRKARYRKRGVTFDIDAHVSLVDGIISTFSAEFFERTRSWGIESELPVFIVGMPRSGTTLVEQIISSHHSVFGAGELPDIEYMVADLPTTLGVPDRYPGCIVQAAPEELHKLAQAHLQRLRGLGGEATNVVDKMTVNFLHLGLIATLFPTARVIHCMRDPRDICVSCYFHNFARAGLCFTFDLEHLGAFYAQYERLMSHWREVLPLQMMDVSYEELVHDQDTGTRNLVAFCGLEWDPDCLAFHKNQRTVKTASALQVRQPIYTTSVGRWKNYQRQLKPFTDWLNSP